LVDGDVGAQTRQCFANLFAVLAAAGGTPADVQKVNVFLTDMADFPAMNAAYAEQFEAPYPARTTVAVAGLPLGARVEIEMVADPRSGAERTRRARRPSTAGQALTR
jgi:2-iminobutanoate/2-iminopropanoate deaminase